MSSHNPYIPLYVNQAGNGLPYFVGDQIQDGHGIGSWIKNIFKSIILPNLKSAGKYAGKKALHGLADFSHEVIGGKNIKEAAKDAFESTGDRIMRDIKGKTQSGQGRRRRAPSKTRKTKKPAAKPKVTRRPKNKYKRTKSNSSMRKLLEQQLR